MPIILDFLEKFYEQGNVSFEFQNNNKKFLYCISLNKDNKLDVLEKQYDEDDEFFYHSNDVSIAVPLAHLVSFSVLKKSVVQNKKFLMNCVEDDIFLKRNEQGINIVYNNLEKLFENACCLKEDFILACESESKFLDFLIKCVPSQIDETLLSDFNTIKILCRNQFRAFNDYLLKGTQLYSDLKNSDKTNYQDRLELWNSFIGKKDNVKSDMPKEAVKTRARVLDYENISYEFLEERIYPVNPAVGRDKELEQLCISLFTLTKSPILVGEAGVGKTAIVEGLGYLIQKGEVPLNLQDKKIMKVSIASLVSGCMYVGSFEKKLEVLMSYMRDNPNVILFLDELHTAVGAGAGSKSDLDLANILKPYLDRSGIKIIGSTTWEEYDNFISRDPAFRRRFEKINVLEPDKLALSQIISSYISKLSILTKVVYPFDEDKHEKIISILMEATESKNRVYNDKRYNPDLVLSIIEKAYAYAQYNSHTSLELEDFSKAIATSNVLYEEIRLRMAKKMMALSNILNVRRAKVLMFPNNSSL